jgi:hypothetical protein
MNEKDKVEAKVTDERWRWDLEMLCDISYHLNYLNMELQNQQKLISDMPWADRAFQM